MLDQSLRKDPIKSDHFITFMDKMLCNARAERAPELQEDEECWYIPIFGIYHPHKPGNIRIVFDSAVKYNGVSLNDVLYTGPDLTNSLLGILMRFRREPVAIIADIEQMFYCFRVNVEHRNLLRFIWHEDNDFSKPLVDYRMCVHIFGSTSSPAIATYRLRKAALLSDRGSDVTDFVHNEFYVDDSLISLQTSEQGIDLITRTQQVLQNEGKLRLHKIASNNIDVMNAFPTADLSKDIKDLDLGSDSLPTQRSLGITWSLDSDMFMFHVSEVQQPFTRRGILSTVNSLFDPLGFLAPVVIEGKILLRNLVQGTTDWDEPLSPQLLDVWENWTSSLKYLQDIKIPRMILNDSFTAAEHKTVHIFCDASEEAISSVGYLQAMVHNDIQLGFIIGKAKVAPSHGHTVPRLELCSAVLAVEIAELISSHLHMPIDNFKFYSDSRIVLGYLNNTSRRFYTYVTNRVYRILSSTKPEQWFYVSSENNPADKATRPISASELLNCAWLNGPSFLKQGESSDNSASFALQDPDIDKEVRPEIKTLKTELGSDSLNLGSHRFERFSNWRKLIRAVSCLQHIAQTFHGDKCSNGWHTCDESHTVHALSAAQNHIFRVVQHEIYHEEIECLKKGQPLPKSSPVIALSPYLDTENILRVGGRLDKSCLTEQEKHPILIPGRHNIAKLIIGHYHDAVYHQGRHITEGSIRSAGIWITNAKSLVSSFISKCVNCRKLRGKLSYQKMANLPPDRSEPSPPFTCVGVDCFGPWQIVSRRTRGGQAASKRWGVMFTCLSTRAVHIEVIEELSSSSFINALRRLIAIRGPVRIFRSDRGTNFVGSTEDLGIQAINTDDTQLKEFLSKNQSTWLFNPPHASHMGGVWERMIGVTRNILNSLLMDLPGGGLTHEVLVTFLAEVSAIINSRPLVALTTDPDEPLPLTPSLLLTQKSLVDTGFCTQIDMKDMYKKQWKRVQVLADMFWTRWKDQYLQSLQNRRKWQDPKRNFCSGDVVLVRDKQSARNNWPVGIVQETYAGHDGLVRKVNVRVVNDGRTSTFTRPVVELVLLVEND